MSMSLDTMNFETEVKTLRQPKLLESLCEKFEVASRGHGIWVGAEESEYIAKIFKGYAELVDKLNGVWTKNE